MKKNGIDEKFSYYGKLIMYHISQFAVGNFDSELILDAGCGDLRYSKELAKNTKNLVIAIDVDPSYMRSLGSRKVENIFKVACDLRKLPFCDNIFDGVANINVFHHLPTMSSLSDVLSEFRRTSRKNVRIFIKENVSNNPLRFLLKRTYNLMPISIKEITVTDKYERAHATHLFDFSTEYLISALTKAGFHVVRNDRQELVMYFVYYILLIFPFLNSFFPDFMIPHFYKLERAMLTRFPFKNFNQSVTVWATRINNPSR
jgi:ubiquinone/menaquinone biosynthesis C-methylase UbiE